MSTVSKPADLTAGPIAPALIRLALPLLFGNILQQLYNTVDAVIVGHPYGGEGVAARPAAHDHRVYQIGRAHV